MTFILVLGSMQDPHVERVVSILEADEGTETVVLDFKKISSVSIRVNVLGEAEFMIDGSKVPSHALVWDRTKIYLGTGLYPAGDERSSAYAAMEWRALHNLFCGFFEGQVVNSLASRRMMLKPFQQMRAAEVGFSVPDSLISNEKSRVVEFENRSPRGLILKSLSGGKIKPGAERSEMPYSIMTMRIEASDITTSTDAEFALCPHFFQFEIDKEFELRVVVAGEFIRAFKINSQEFQSSSLDWRNGIEVLKFEPFDIGKTTEKKIHAFMKKMGFVFGSIDLIVDNAGTTWFLECNQDGQWAWLDDVVKGELAKAFASELLERARLLSGRPSTMLSIG